MIKMSTGTTTKAQEWKTATNEHEWREMTKSQ